MSAQEYQNKSIDELRELAVIKSTELQDYVQNLLKNKEKNTSGVKYMKKEIARIKTVLNQKERAENV